MNTETELQLLQQRLETDGWLVIPEVFEGSLLDVLAEELHKSLALREVIRARNKVEGANDGTLHHLLADHPAYVEVLSRLERFDPLLRWFFSGNYILNSYGGVINRRDQRAYVHAIHRDIRFSSDVKRFMLNILVMLDDFTLENGATHLLAASQFQAEKPDADHFYRNAGRAMGKRGSIIVFDSRIWHATGQSMSDSPRRALTLTFTSPFFKPQLDYPRLMASRSPEPLSQYLRQVIGFNARVPATLDEYYVPVADRFYKRGQDD